MKPQVSVIIPFFEGLPWLARSIRSVQEQQGVCWELIIIDDGSKQDPTAIVQSLQDARLRLVRIEHSGKGAALNIGVTNSKADIVCFLDQDDIMNPGRLTLQCEAFLRTPDVDVIYSDYERVYDDGRFMDRFISHQASNKQCLKSMARGMGLVSMQIIMMKKSTFHEIGGFSNDIQLTGLDDAEFFVRLFASGAVLKYVPGVVQKWVLHGQNYSQSAAFQETRLIYLRHLSDLARNNPVLQRELPHFRYHTFYMRGLFYLENGMIDEAISELTKVIRMHPFKLNSYYLILKSLIIKLVRRIQPMI
jgi:glycosyltransferase involved in cell wall biosynthesis